MSLICDNSKIQSSKLWNDYCRRYQVTNKPTEPYHPQQNAFKRVLAKWKTDTVKLILMSNCDPRAWFHAWMHVADLHNHKARLNNPISLPPITDAYGEVSDITLLTTFHFNEDIYYQNYAYQFPDSGGNERPGKWLGRALGVGDNSCSHVLDMETE